MNKQDEIKQLVKKITDADILYHTFDASDISDAEYDALKDRVRALDPTNPILKKIGNSVDAKSPKLIKSDIKSSIKDKHWEKVDHGDYKMGSQNKVNTNQELIDWCNKTKDDSYVVQHKMDGMSMKLIYDNCGILTFALTRGEGDVGENIYRNVLKIHRIPRKVTIKHQPISPIVRGEIILKKSNFDKVGGKNARNSAAGTAKRLDGEGCEHLSFIAYSIMNWKELGIKTETDAIQMLSDFGFETVPTYNCKNAKEIEDVMQEYKSSKRSLLDWDIDGLVIKTNNIKDDDWALPKRSVAYKFEAEKGVTKLLDVVWQDSGGRINPVALLEPIKIGGITVSKATLNNIEFIRNMKVKIGDLVVVSRRNDVIPCIEGVSVSDKNGKEIKPPEKDEDGYPIVHAVNSQGEKLVYLVSTNPNSKAKKIRQIMKWYEAHETKGLAEETISLILDSGVATDLPSFFVIGLNGHTDLAGLDGFGSGKFRILNKATRMTEVTDLIKFFNAIDIPGFGTSRFETILENNNKPIDVSGFIDLCSDCTKISAIQGFGMNTAESLAAALKEKKKLIDEMLKLVKVEPWQPIKVTKSSINGLSFCFTGSMSYDRDVLEKSVKKNGGIVAGVSKKLDYLVTNDPNSGSGKNEKADKLGIKKITEKEFLDMLDVKP